jgi:hypothetical protein
MNLADAKNHGMIFFVDFSGSMVSQLGAVLEHLLCLVQFCNKVDIPFQVFAFTSGWHRSSGSESQYSEYSLNLENVILAEIFSSKMSKREYHEAFTRISDYVLISDMSSDWGRRSDVHQILLSNEEELGGTPLNHSLIAAHTIIDDFRKFNSVEKLNVMVLSDGDSHNVNFGKGGRCRSKIAYSSVIRGKYQAFNNNTESYLKLLKTYNDINLICFFLPNCSRDASYKIDQLAKQRSQVSKLKKSYRKDKCLAVKDSLGYDTYFLLPHDIKIEDKEEFVYESSGDISQNRTEQGKLARSFAKHSIANRKNRTILNKFAEIIA